MVSKELSLTLLEKKNPFHDPNFCNADITLRKWKVREMFFFLLLFFTFTLHLVSVLEYSDTKKIYLALT